MSKRHNWEQLSAYLSTWVCHTCNTAFVGNKPPKNRMNIGLNRHDLDTMDVYFECFPRDIKKIDFDFHDCEAMVVRNIQTE